VDYGWRFTLPWPGTREFIGEAVPCFLGEQRLKIGHRRLECQIQVQWRDGDIAVGNGFEVGLVPRRLDGRRKAEPEIGKSARVGALDDPQAAVMAQAL